MRLGRSVQDQRDAEDDYFKDLVEKTSKYLFFLFFGGEGKEKGRGKKKNQTLKRLFYFLFF